MSDVDTEAVLREVLDKIAKEQNYKNPNVSVRTITTDGANYSSVLYVATISAKNKDDLELFAKVANMGDAARSQFHVPVFDLERFAYIHLLPAYAKIQDNYKLTAVNKLLWPKFYGYNPNLYEETIVLENLAVEGYVTYDRLKSIDWAYASKAVESLAKFHALSIAYGVEDPEEYEKLLEKFKYNAEAIANMSILLEKSVEMGITVTKEENKDRLSKYIEQQGNFKDMAKYFQPTGLVLLTHGDYRPSNLMHKTKEDGSIEVIPVDFQTIVANSPVVDLFYFIFIGSDEQFRREHYEQLIEYYYQELTRALRNLNLNVDKYYTRENYNEDLEKFIPFGLFISLFLLPVITVEAENAPSLQGEDGFNTIVTTKTSNLYPERVNGIVNDYIRWGIL
ncbi:uncharacterized protein LOC131846337 [Achroia grisella]|uniref:uncharacterized protein LOC131846337 n=1 Tax=Achroia grisella TaxID=688607 RepID=UPI0027D21D14|nr:uncharacterized protein LOC131846337 [Achroia grisella]